MIQKQFHRKLLIDHFILFPLISVMESKRTNKKTTLQQKSELAIYAEKSTI